MLFICLHFFTEKSKSKSTKRESSKSNIEIKQNKKHKDITEKPVLQLEHKDKHNKLRETIEKLKAKSEISSKLKEKDIALFDSDNKKTKNSYKKHKMKLELDGVDGNNTVKKNVEIEALTLATEQTLKDINKWLDDTPKFSEFSSGSNSPSHYIGVDEFDVGNGVKNEKGKVKKDVVQSKKRPVQRDPSKLLKRREIQRTIDRLQPGKSKGNLLSAVQPKVEEIFPLGPLSKIKDTKNSLIVKTDDNTPKLSLGSVLDSFGKHKFIEDKDKLNAAVAKVDEKKEIGDGNSATPNLSAWFKAFGAPKKKGDAKTENKSDEQKKEEEKKVSPPEPSPNPESPAVQPRQRKISTGSSMSERSSFSQDMDSPRIGIDERLGNAYPAPYPSPLHHSPSPRADVSPKAPSYPTFNGQIRVGFYQDTVSTKSSPDKSSCSPRETSPYNQYSEHNMYMPSSTNYYSQPNYSSSNPTPPYNTENVSSPSFYDTNKPLTDQYQAKTVPNYSVSSESSPTSQPNSPQMEIVQQENKIEKQQFPVKKRAYNDEQPPPPPPQPHYDLQQQAQEYNEMNLMTDREATPKQYVHQNIPKVNQMPPQQQEIESREQYAYSGGGGDGCYPRQDVTSTKQVDMSKYTNMGYTGPDMNFVRDATGQFGNFSRDHQQQHQQHQQQQVNSAAELNMSMRYSNQTGKLCIYITLVSMHCHTF